jgi:hypothetical protein
MVDDRLCPSGVAGQVFDQHHPSGVGGQGWSVHHSNLLIVQALANQPRADLVAAVISAQHDEWTESRRHLGHGA